MIPTYPRNTPQVLTIKLNYERAAQQPENGRNLSQRPPSNYLGIWYLPRLVDYGTIRRYAFYV